MRVVTRDEIVDYETYREQRDSFRARILEMKKPRRIHVGNHLTFLFENHETVRYQIQEMTLAGKVVKEADILHEIETYNELLGGPGGLGATLLVEIDNAAEREDKLTRWRTLPSSLYVRLPDGTRVAASFDARQIDERRLSSVQYLRFAVNGIVPYALGCDHEELTAETVLSPAQQDALAQDLRSTSL